MIIIIMMYYHITAIRFIYFFAFIFREERKIEREGERERFNKHQRNETSQIPNAIHFIPIYDNVACARLTQTATECSDVERIVCMSREFRLNSYSCQVCGCVVIRLMVIEMVENTKRGRIYGV